MIKIATLVGCAIGDALGNPFEMWSVDKIKSASWDGKFKAGGTFWKGKAGQYTDDTLMSLALSTSLLQCNKFEPEDVAREYLAWYDSGNTRGIGTTTATALHALRDGATYLESGLKRQYDGLPVGGNGTAMRASPLGLVYRFDLAKLMECAIKDAAITHNSLEPKVGSAAVALGVALLANRISDPASVLADTCGVLADSLVKDKIQQAMFFIEQAEGSEKALAEIGTAGYVPETVGAAFYCLGATESFQDAITMAVKGGGDTDTTAAIVGALAGTWYGLEGIPQEYKDQVEDFQLLQNVTDELLLIEVEH